MAVPQARAATLADENDGGDEDAERVIRAAPSVSAPTEAQQKSNSFLGFGFDPTSPALNNFSGSSRGRSNSEQYTHHDSTNIFGNEVLNFRSHRGGAVDYTVDGDDGDMGSGSISDFDPVLAPTQQDEDRCFDDGGGSGVRCRGRSASYHDELVNDLANEMADFPIDSSGGAEFLGGGGAGTGGCDLGWGETVLPEPEPEPESDAEGPHDFDLEDRPQQVPEVDPHWQRRPSECSVRGRGRSQSFYEGDDGDTMACINGETDSRAGVSPVDAVGFGFTGTRFSSLAYSSSGDMTAAELGARTKPRARSRSEDFTPALDPSELNKGSDDCRGIERTRLVSGTSPVFLSCSRGLKPNEIQALQQGLHAPIPSRKYSSDHDLSSDSEPEGETYSSEEDAGMMSPPDCDPYDDPDGQFPPSVPFFSDMPLGPQYAALKRAGTFSPRSMHAIQAGDNDGDNHSPISPPPAPDLVAPQQQQQGEGNFGSKVYPAGVDPLSLPEDHLSPPVSPRRDGGAGVVLRSPPGSAPAPFVSHPPPPDHSPPRWPPPASVESAGGGGRDDEEVDQCGNVAEAGRSPGGEENARDSEAFVRTSSRPRSPTLSLWPTEEADGSRVSVAGAMEEEEDEEEGGESRESDDLYCQEEELLARGGSGPASGRLDESIGSSPASFESLRPSSRDRRPNMVPIPPSPFASAPSQLAPPPPPPEPLAPPPPRPRTPDEPLARQQGSLLPESPAEPAPTVGARSRQFTQPESPSLPGFEQRRMDGGNWRSSGEGGKGGGQFNNLAMPPPHSPASGPRSTAYPSGGNIAVAGGGGVGGAGKIGSPAFGSGGGGGAGPPGSVGSSASASTRAESSWKANTTGSFNSGGSGTGGGGGGGISRLVGPNGPFGSNRPGYGSGGCGGRARYHSGGSSGNGRSYLYGSAPGTLGDGSSSWSEQGLRGSSHLGFLSAGGGSHRHGLRRGHQPAQRVHKIKLLMLGDSGVGKSSLVERFTDDHFNPSTVGTFGVDYKLKETSINDEEVTVQVWDTAGQQRFHKITQAYYRGSNGIVLVYDVANPETLDNIAYWMQSIRDNADSQRVQIGLVGNKVDLRSQGGGGGRGQTNAGAMAETQRGREIAQKFGAHFFECSAKTGCMVQEAFMTVAMKAFEAYMLKPPTPSGRSKRHGLRRRKPQRQVSQGSEKDRPPRSDASWSTSSSFSGVDGVERLDGGSRMRQSASDMSEISSAVSVSSQASAANSTPPSSHAASASFQRGNSFTITGSPSASSSSASVMSGSNTPSTTTVAGCPPPMLIASSSGTLQDLMPPLSAISPEARTPPTPDTGKGRGEKQGGGVGGKRLGKVGVLLKGRRGVSSSGTRKYEEDEGDGDAEDEDSPTGTGTLSPLPGTQRSLGRSSSLGDAYLSFSPPRSPSNVAPSPARRRAGTTGLIERVFGPDLSGGLEGGDNGASVWGRDRGPGGEISVEGVAEGSDRGSINTLGSGAVGSEDVTAHQQQRSSRGGGNRESDGRIGISREDGKRGGASRVKGTKPPRAPRMKRFEGGRGGVGGPGNRRGCKVS